MVGDEDRLARTTIQRAILERRRGHPQDVLSLVDFDAPEFSPTRNCDLYLMAVTVAVNAYCDLGQPREASELLRRSLDYFDRSTASIAGPICRGLQGRVALGRGKLDDAERLFRDAHEAMLSLGRHLDAAAYLLYLADVLLQAEGCSPRLVALRSSLKLAGDLIESHSGRQLGVVWESAYPGHLGSDRAQKLLGDVRIRARSGDTLGSNHSGDAISTSLARSWWLRASRAGSSG
jgi:hypothetical protein